MGKKKKEVSQIPAPVIVSGKMAVQKVRTIKVGVWVKSETQGGKPTFQYVDTKEKYHVPVNRLFMHTKKTEKDKTTVQVMYENGGVEIVNMKDLVDL